MENIKQMNASPDSLRNCGFLGGVNEKEIEDSEKEE
jgi:hypothetical protein